MINPGVQKPCVSLLKQPTLARVMPVMTPMPVSAVNVMPVASWPRAVACACSCRWPPPWASRLVTRTLSGEPMNASSRARSMTGRSALT